MEILVTGGAGFIGSNFARFWADRHPGDGVVVYDALTYAGNLANLEPYLGEGRLSFVHGDIANLELVSDVLAEREIDVVVNFAAESHNSLAVLDPARFFRTNVLGTQALCEAARRAGVQRLHHVSTCEVYGDLDLDSDEAFDESSPYRPRTPYNASKAGADHVVRSYGETFGLSFSITNCANNYGPYQFPEKVLPLFTTRAIDNEALPVYESAHHRREWIHVDDHCSAIEAVLQRGEPGETYHVGTGREASVTEIADAVLSATGRPQSLKTVVPDRPGHDRRYLLDSTKIRKELGWEPAVGFEEGVGATVAWYIEHESWWRPLIGRSPVVEGSWGTPPATSPPPPAAPAPPASQA
jgi:dTDP-glucose 4,6-dehydratase